MPLSALLSFALVAFTIEADNEAEHRVPHRTARYGSSETPGPWLVSMVMWFNCLRWIPAEGIAVLKVERLARTRTNWNGMQRWGYLYFEPSLTDARPKPPQSALIARVTAKGAIVRDVWRDLIPEIEARWRERFGGGQIDALRTAVSALTAQLDPGLPDCLPIQKWGLSTERPIERNTAQDGDDTEAPYLPALLAKALLAFALEFEGGSAVSLSISANVLRVVADGGTAIRELPQLAGVSKEGVAMAMSFLTKRGYAVVESAKGRVKMTRLTEKGLLAKAHSRKLLEEIEQHWSERYASSTMEPLRLALEGICGDGTAEHSPLAAGLEPYADGWRARVRKPETLPHFPMILHRGGYPDGS